MSYTTFIVVNIWYRHE